MSVFTFACLPLRRCLLAVLARSVFRYCGQIGHRSEKGAGDRRKYYSSDFNCYLGLPFSLLCCKYCRKMQAGTVRFISILKSMSRNWKKERGSLLSRDYKRRTCFKVLLIGIQYRCLCSGILAGDALDDGEQFYRKVSCLYEFSTRW